MSQLLNDPATLIALAALGFAVYWSVFRKKAVPAQIRLSETASPPATAAPLSIREAIEAEETLEARRMLNGLHSVKRYMEAEADRVALARGLLSSIKGSVDKATSPNP